MQGAPGGFIHGALCLIRGYRLIGLPGLRRYVLIPLTVNTLLFAAAIWWLGAWFDAGMDHWLPDWLGWLQWLLWPLFALAVLIGGFFGFTLIANLIAGPFNGLLAERVETRLGGRTPPKAAGGLASALAAIPAAIGGELQKWLYFLAWAVALLLCALIPVINLLAPALWLLFGAWCLALEFADFPLGNRGLDFKAQRRLLRAHRGAALGFGAAVMGASVIPIVNFALMPAAVAGATVLSLPLRTPEIHR